MAISVGPWFVEVVGYSISVRCRKRVVARMAIAANSTMAKDGFDNANLIAAAPELLAALKAVVAIGDRKHDAWDAAYAAIAKAEGVGQ